MKYTLINTSTSDNTIVYVNDEPTDEFFVGITLTIEVELGLDDPEIKNPIISKSLTVISNKSMTGFEIEAQRKQAIENYMININS